MTKLAFIYFDNEYDITEEYIAISKKISDSLDNKFPEKQVNVIATMMIISTLIAQASRIYEDKEHFWNALKRCVEEANRQVEEQTTIKGEQC